MKNKKNNSANESAKMNKKNYMYILAYGPCGKEYDDFIEDHGGIEENIDTVTKYLAIADGILPGHINACRILEPDDADVVNEVFGDLINGLEDNVWVSSCVVEIDKKKFDDIVKNLSGLS